MDAELADARKAATAGEWALAAKHYDAALAALPQLETGEVERAAMRIRVSSAKAKLEGSKLIEAEKELSALVDELTEMDASYADLLEEAKEGHANTKFYITWLMRLEGYQRSDWEARRSRARVRPTAASPNRRAPAATSSALTRCSRASSPPSSWRASTSTSCRASPAQPMTGKRDLRRFR